MTDPFDQIREPTITPSDVPDAQSADEMSVANRMAELTPAARNIHLSERLLKNVEDERDRLIEIKSWLVDKRDGLQASHDRLQTEVCESREKLARVEQSHRSMKFSLALSSLSFAVGGSLISQFAASDPKWSFFGWGLVVVASVYLLIKSIFDA